MTTEAVRLLGSNTEEKKNVRRCLVRFGYEVVLDESEPGEPVAEYGGQRLEGSEDILQTLTAASREEAFRKLNAPHSMPPEEAYT